MPRSTPLFALSLCAGLVAGAATAEILRVEAAPATGAGPVARPLSKTDPAARAAYRDYLFEALAAADSAEAGREVEQRIWRFWHEGPSRDASLELSVARNFMEEGLHEAAFEAYEAVIAAFPDWAEPYNQRAILHFVREEYDAALADIDRTLAREPKHFGALSGGAHIHFAAGRAEAGLRLLAEAAAIHPWIGGRTPPGYSRGGSAGPQIEPL